MSTIMVARNHSARRGGLLIALLGMFFSLTFVNTSHATVYVSTTGNDTVGTGTFQKPFQTLSRALQTGDGEIIMHAGTYDLAEPVTIPPDTVLIGSYMQASYPGQGIQWWRGHEPTILRLPTVSAQASIVVSEGASVEWLQTEGGFYAFDVNQGGRLFEVTMRSSAFASIIVRGEGRSTPASIDSCVIRGGGNGIRVEDSANVVVEKVFIDRPSGRGMYITGNGGVFVFNSVIQRGNSDGIAILGNSGVAIQNCAIRANVGDGISVSQAGPFIRGCLIEKNRTGIRMIQADGTNIDNNTVVANRSTGIYLREGQPNLRANIIARNGGFGVYEDRPEPIIDYDDDGTTITITFETHVAALDHNLFWANASFEYHDEGEVNYSTAEDINSLVINTIAPAGNIVADPEFLDFDKGNYRLAEQSPALDAVALIDGFDLDLDGLERAFDTGAGGGGPVDRGAFEYHPGLVRGFGATYYSESRTIDPNTNTALLLRSSPEWEFRQSPYFDMPDNYLLPGRLRLSSTSNYCYGEIARIAEDSVHGEDELIIVKTNISSTTDDLSRGSFRLRINGPSELDFATLNSFLGSKPLSPAMTGTEYTVITDLRQGGYRQFEPGAKPEYEAYFSIDNLDFGDIPLHTPLDVTRFQVERVSRAVYDAQFTKQVVHYTFDSAAGLNWVSAVLPEFFNTPRLRYVGSLDALELTQFRDNSYGTWASLGDPVPIGKPYKVDFLVSTPQSPAEAPWFRVRAGFPNFEASNELVINSRPNSAGAATNDGQWYTIYGVVPEQLRAEYNADEVDLFLCIDLFGFTADRPPTGTLYLNEVIISTTD